MNIDSKTEKNKIIQFVRRILKEQGFKKVVIALSGGIDSTTSLFLLKEALPVENVLVLHLPYFKVDEKIEKIIKSSKIPKKNVFVVNIKKPVDDCLKLLKVKKTDKVRVGNIMARTRMIITFDFAKKLNALVCGTENKSEHYLGYFTRFGDEASDFEPIRYLYKTQIFELARYLGTPKEVIEQNPTAGLWNGQTDENEFGFTYKEADQVINLYFEKKLTVKKIEQKGFKNAKKIIDYCLKNSFKHEVPYIIRP